MSDRPPEDPIKLWAEYHSGVASSSRNNKKSVMRQFEAWLAERGTDNVLDARLIDVKNYLEGLYDDGDGLAGSTVHQYHVEMKSFYNDWIDPDDDDEDRNLLAEHEYELGKNPAKFDLSEYLDYSRKSDKQQYADNNEGIIHLRGSEVRQLRQATESVRDELLVKLLTQTGLRRGEVSALRLPEYQSESHIDPEEQTVHISDDDAKTDDGGRKVGYQDLEPELTMWLEQGYRDRHPTSDSPYLFITGQTERLSPTSISRIIREAADDAGIQEVYGYNADGSPKRRITPHALRSTFIINLFEAGLPSPEVMELSGHEQLETVEKYANVLGDDAVKAYRQADIDFEA